MKILVNGGLNLSELNGWGAETCDPGVGWTLTATSCANREHSSDAEEADRLFRILEDEVHAYSGRVVPRTPGTGVPFDLPLIAWQR